MNSQDITLMMYNITLLPIIFFSLLYIILIFINLFVNKSPQRTYRQLKELPFISVQVPTFNDPIAVRCVEKCMRFDYPQDKYEIIIADDSTNLNTQALLKRFATDNPGFIKYIHRDNREGFKPGALKNAMKITRGEIIVIFDADWIPRPEFLKTVIRPFSNPRVAIVQTRQGVYNHKTNLITRFAAYLLMIYSTIIMPINNKINCVFFCGTAGAIRRKAFERVGGWNLNSITEDSDLSVNLLLRGYETVFLDFETPSEVPETFESFIKQQMRWCYGNVRVFFDNAFKIIFSEGISLKQRAMIIFLTLGNVTAPIVVLMTLFGLVGWFSGDLHLFTISDIINPTVKFVYTAGFMLMGVFTLYKRKMMDEIPYLFLSAFTMGVILSVAISIAFVKAVFNKKLHWFCTPKIANELIALK